MAHFFTQRSLQCPSPSCLQALALAVLGLQLAMLPAAHASIAQPTEPFTSYTVQRGDNIAKLSQKLLLKPSDFAKLAKLNGLKNPALLQPGFVIDVPRSMLNLSSQPAQALTGQLLNASGDVLVNNQAASAGAVIAQGDRVQTGASASATIQLADGSRIQLMPRTIAEVTQQSQYAMKDPASSISTTWFSGAIRLVEGLLDIAADKTTRRAKPLGVITSTSTLGVRGTQFRVGFEDPASGSVRTEVLEGLVRTDNPATSAGAEVAGGYGTAFKPQDRTIQVVPLLPALDIAALPEQVLRPLPMPGVAQMPALWRIGSLAGASGYRVEVARDEAFTQPVLQSRSTQPSVDMSSLANGSYFARVRGYDAQAIEGYNAMRRITISDAPVPPAPAPPPAPTVWIHEIGIAANAIAQDSALVLQLNKASVDTPAQLTLEIAEDASMSQSLQKSSVDAQGRAVLPKLSVNSTYYVRVSGLTRDGRLQRSGIYLLRLPADWGATVLALSDALLLSSPATAP